MVRTRAGAATGADAVALIAALPDELLLHVLLGLSAADLARAAQSCRLWRRTVAQAAAVLLKRRRPTAQECPCWLRCLGAVERLEAAVGPRPSRSWRSEYVELQLEAQDMVWYKYHALSEEEDFEEGGEFSVDEDLKRSPEAIADLTASGWSTDAAHSFLSLAGCDAALSAAIRERSSRYAATTHYLMDNLFNYARRTPAPYLSGHSRLLYSPLTGSDGLATHYGSAFLPHSLDRVGVGGSFTVEGASAMEPSRRHFRNVRGWHAYEPRSVQEYDPSDHYLEDSDIIAFCSAPPDGAGYHAMMLTVGEHSHEGFPEEAIYCLPPFTRLTIERIDAPGEWKVLGMKVQRTLYTVSASFGC